jgi:hypothetical protein
MIREFLGTCPIFNPLHMDDVDGTYKQSNFRLNDVINLNEDSMDVIEVTQDFNVKQVANVNDTWMFKVTLSILIPPTRITRSLIKFKQEINGDYANPIKLNMITTLPSCPTSTLPIHLDVTMPLSDDITMSQFSQKEVPPGINLPRNPPTLISMNKHSNIPKTQNGKSSTSTKVKRTHFPTHKNIVEVVEKRTKILVEFID